MSLKKFPAVPKVLTIILLLMALDVVLSQPYSTLSGQSADKNLPLAMVQSGTYDDVTVANLYNAMYLEANNAYSYSLLNNYEFIYWNVASDQRSLTTTSYMPMVPLWIYIVTGNTTYLNWAERSVDVLYKYAFFNGTIVPLNGNLKVDLNDPVKVDYPLHFIGAAINLYEITENSTYLGMACKVTDGLLSLFSNSSTGLLMGNEYSFSLGRTNRVISTIYLGDYACLLHKLYSYTGIFTYEEYVLRSIGQLTSLQNLSPTKLIATSLDASGYPQSSSCVIPADFISGFSVLYSITHSSSVLNLLNTQGAAFVDYGFDSTLQRFVYKVDSQTGCPLDSTLYESWAYAAVGAYSWLYSVTNNSLFEFCAQKTFDTFFANSYVNGIHISKIGINNEPLESHYYFFGKNYDLPYGVFWLYYSTRNETLRSLFSNLTQSYLTDFRMPYGFASEVGSLTKETIDPSPALPVISRNYEIALLLLTGDFSSGTVASTCHQGSYYYGPLLNLDSKFGSVTLGASLTYALLQKPAPLFSPAQSERLPSPVIMPFPTSEPSTNLPIPAATFPPLSNSKSPIISNLPTTVPSERSPPSNTPVASIIESSQNHSALPILQHANRDLTQLLFGLLPPFAVAAAVVVGALTVKKHVKKP